MTSVFYEALGLLLMFLVLGIIWASVDIVVGTPLRRWWHKMTHKDPLPESDQRGFIVGQSARRKLSVAFIVSTIQSVYVYWHAEHPNFLTEFILWFLESGVMLFGFYLAKPVAKIKDFVMNRIASNLDRVEAGEVTVGELAGETTGKVVDSIAGTADTVARNAADRVGGIVSEGINRMRKAKQPEVPKVEAVPNVEAAPKPEPPDRKIDHRSVLERFKRGS